jgi:hypothetical protein
MYRCLVCGGHTPESVIGPGIAPGFGVGRCQSCRRYTQHRVIPDGDALKAEGQALVVSGRAATWSETAIRWIESQPTGSVYTSETITGWLGQPPSSGAVGAVMTGAAKRGLHRKHIIVKAQRPNQHSAEIWQWIRL